MPEHIAPEEGRSLFGLNVHGYDAARPDYPEAFYSHLLDSKALAPGMSVLDIGAGNGLASKALLAAGADPITLIEPDERFSALLEALRDQYSAQIRIIHTPFEEADLPTEAFDLVVSATSFHWLDPDTRVARLAEVVKPGGHVALLGHVFRDLYKPDAFHEATKTLFRDHAVSPTGAPDAVPFMLRRAEREAEFIETGSFERASYLEVLWTLTLDPGEIGLLYESFSSTQRLREADRVALLDALKKIAVNEFAGSVERHMTSTLYLFRRLG